MNRSNSSEDRASDQASCDLEEAGQSAREAPQCLVPEPAYFSSENDLGSEANSLTVLYCLLPLATHVEMWPVGYPDKVEVITLSGGENDRRKIFGEAIERVRRLREQEFGPDYPLPMGLVMRQGPRTLVDQHDGDFGVLFLTDRELETLQNCLVMHGLPRDLYFPRSDEHVVIEVREGNAGIFKVEERYSPLEWERRHSPGEFVDVPSESDRTSAFSVACAAFERALSLRILELEEPGRIPDWAIIDQLRELRQRVDQLMTQIGISKSGQDTT